MSLSVSGVGQAASVQQTKSAVADQDSGPAKTPVKFGSSPAAAVTLSAQAQARAKALAIKNGHDPDGVQDGK